ncbi:sodium-independent sulfate anion transporter-like [Bacillus rossius redtenbacheri]|uniref:sodium-independent sulfate anion transporter-like n=1 Tax=Bacillus rossius redtenbacheri TaxID=93214 RepID=UPI002FDDEB07
MAACSQPLIHSPTTQGSAEPERLWRRGKEVLFRHVSILTWLPRYTREDAMGDLVAGVTLGLTMMPQGIAYASLAGLTAQYGLYSSFMGGLVYMVFGTIKEVSIGITSLMSLMTFEYTHDLPVEFVFLLTFLTGCLQLVMGCLNLGILVDFISMPVTSGFTTATSLIIIGSQLKGLLGLSFKARSFIDNVSAVIAHAGETRLWDAVLGVVCILVLLLTRLLKNIHLGPKEAMKQTCIQRIVNKSLWFLCIARNAIVVVACSALAYRFTQSGTSPFQLSGTIQPGLPPFGLPPFTVQFNNRTYSFLDMCKQLGSGIFVTPIISVLANVGIAKAFSAGKSLDATQEMLTLGLCNVLGSLVQSTPTTGAFTRSAVSHASGVKTPMAGLYSATLILLALSYLTPYFYYIPKAVLSAVLIAAVVFMVDYQTMVLLWKKSKRDLLLLLITLAISLVLSVEVGLLVGTLFNAAHLLYAWARPSMDVKMCKTQQGLQYVLVSPDLGLLYPAMDYLKTELGSVAANQGRGQLPVALNCASFKGIDYSAAQGLKLIVKHFKINEQPFILLNAQPRVRAFLHSNDVSGALYADSEDEIAEVLFEWSADSQQESPQCNGADTKVACESEMQDYRLQLEQEKPAP